VALSDEQIGRYREDGPPVGSPVRVPLPVTAALGLFDTQRLMQTSHFADTPEAEAS